MNKLSAVLIALLVAGCSSQPAQKHPSPVVDRSKCSAVEGSTAKIDRRGHPVYKYICDGQVAWFSDVR